MAIMNASQPSNSTIDSANTSGRLRGGGNSPAASHWGGDTFDLDEDERRARGMRGLLVNPFYTSPAARTTSSKGMLRALSPGGAGG